jgi:acyl-CoA dehydrogenase
MIPRTLFSAEHDLFRDQVRRFIAAEITLHHA